VLIVNYPSNPTAETVDLAFYERLVAWAKENKVWILSDLAYSELYYDGKPTPSILQVPGAKDVAVEFTSMSKTYSMAGWRMGFAVGNQQLIAALTRVKSYLDYGAFTPIQAAACAALNGPQDIVETNRELYQKRRDVLVEASAGPGGTSRRRKASMFAWAPLPPALKDMGSLEFSKQLLTHAEVAVAPGVGYGEDGEGFVRIAMVENEQRLRQARAQPESRWRNWSTGCCGWSISPSRCRAIAAVARCRSISSRGRLSSPAGRSGCTRASLRCCGGWPIRRANRSARAN
jgi:alanine-synthesizing transaminase